MGPPIGMDFSVPTSLMVPNEPLLGVIASLAASHGSRPLAFASITALVTANDIQVAPIVVATRVASRSCALRVCFVASLANPTLAVAIISAGLVKNEIEVTPARTAASLPGARPNRLGLHIGTTLSARSAAVALASSRDTPCFIRMLNCWSYNALVCLSTMEYIDSLSLLNPGRYRNRPPANSCGVPAVISRPE